MLCINVCTYTGTRTLHNYIYNIYAFLCNITMARLHMCVQYHIKNAILHISRQSEVLPIVLPFTQVLPKFYPITQGKTG